MPVHSVHAPVPILMITPVALKIMGTAILIFTMFGGFVRFDPFPSLVWMCAYCVIGLNFIFNPHRFIHATLTHWPVFLIPIFALSSTLWSVAPWHTAMASLQLTMTVFIALSIGQSLTTRQIMLAVFLGQGFGLMMSLMNLGVGFMPATSAVNGTLLGLYGHKTALGYSAVLSAYGLIAWLSFRNLARWGFLYAVLVLPLVIATASVTAMLGYIGLFILLLLGLFHRLPPLFARRAFALAGIVMTFLTCAGIASFIAFETQTLTALGKNTTLTGRTVLWDIAFSAWSDRPMIGNGFSAFWHSATYASDVAFVHSYVDDRLDGFHNAFIEVMVALGFVGLVLMLVLTLIPICRLSARVFLHRSLPALIWAGLMITFVLPAMLIQDVGFKQHSASYVLLVLCYCFAARSGACRDETA